MISGKGIFFACVGGIASVVVDNYVTHVFSDPMIVGIIVFSAILIFGWIWGDYSANRSFKKWLKKQPDLGIYQSEADAISAWAAESTGKHMAKEKAKKSARWKELKKSNL